MHFRESGAIARLLLENVSRQGAKARRTEGYMATWREIGLVLAGSALHPQSRGGHPTLSPGRNCSGPPRGVSLYSSLPFSALSQSNIEDRNVFSQDSIVHLHGELLP